MTFPYSDEGSALGGLGNMDASTVQALLQAAPAIQQAQRRAQQLQQLQQGYMQQAATPQGGGVAPTMRGGLYQTVGKWMPDYQAAGQAISGAMNAYANQPQANAAEDQYNALRNAAILRGIQQASSSNPNSAGFGGNLWGGQGGGWSGQSTPMWMQQAQAMQGGGQQQGGGVMGGNGGWTPGWAGNAQPPQVQPAA